MKVRHSAEFERLLAESKTRREVWRKIRIITQMAPLLIFWVAPDGRVIEVEGSHRKSPPNGDRSVFCPGHKGHLRGRATQISNAIYVVVYCKPSDTLSKSWLDLLTKSTDNLLNCLRVKYPDLQGKIDRAVFVDEYGYEIC